MLLKRALVQLITPSTKAAASNNLALTDLPPFITRPFEHGQITAEDVPVALNELANNSTVAALGSGKLRSQNQQQFRSYLQKHFHKYQPQLESLAYRRSAQVSAPVSIGEMGATAGFGVALPKILSHVPFLGGHSMSWKDSAKTFVSPKGIAPTAMIATGMSALHPLEDPQFRRGERSYAKSWWEGMKGESENLGEKAQEARKQYGAWKGAPVQMLHGMLNPIPSMMYGARSIKDYLSSKQGAVVIARAATVIDRLLEKTNAI